MPRDNINPVPTVTNAAPPPDQAKEPPKEPLAEEVPLTAREWWAQNGPALAIVLGLVIFCAIKFNFWAVVKAAVGLSFVVFIHELGHFLVAKWCDVHVTTFSIGFGPAIPGCSFQWGETNYRLGLIPLGGYVQMVGQVDGDEGSDGSEDDPRSFRNKGVGQRMAIISAGVIMNVILAIICFVVVFRGPGKDRIAGTIGLVDNGAPAFKYGLRPGMEILQIGDVKNPYFENLMVTVMGAWRGQKLELVAKRPEDAVALDTKIEPQKGELKFIIGIAPASMAELVQKKHAPDVESPVYPGYPAMKITPGFDFGDKIVASTDPDHPKEMKPLPDDPRFPGKGHRDFFELSRRLQRLAGQNVVLRVQRDEGEHAHIHDITVPPTFNRTLGMRMQMGHITGLRDDSPAQKAGVRVSRKNEKGLLIKGDLIQKVAVTEPDEKSPTGEKITTFEGKTLDPERLPFQLKQWAQRLEKAQVKGPWLVTLHVKRYKDFGEAPEQNDQAKMVLEWDNTWRYDQMIPMGRNSPLAIPELGLAYQIKTIVADVNTDLVKDSPLQPGDSVKEIRVTFTDPTFNEGKIAFKKEDEDLEQWAFVLQWLQSPLLSPVIDKVYLKVVRTKEPLDEIELQLTEDKTWPVAETGLIFAKDTRRQWASTTPEAISLGFKDTWDSMTQVFQNLRGMVTGTISVENLGGPVTIARFAYKLAYMDFWEFVFFLGLISVNLAVINFLPIPVLDGGHMVFLIYEKLRGKPASEGVRIGATYAGLVLIGCLMIFVLWLDFSRLFSG